MSIYIYINIAADIWIWGEGYVYVGRGVCTDMNKDSYIERDMGTKIDREIYVYPLRGAHFYLPMYPFLFVSISVSVSIYPYICLFIAIFTHLYLSLYLHA